MPQPEAIHNKRAQRGRRVECAARRNDGVHGARLDALAAARPRVGGRLAWTAPQAGATPAWLPPVRPQQDSCPRASALHAMEQGRHSSSNVGTAAARSMPEGPRAPVLSCSASWTRARQRPVCGRRTVRSNSFWMLVRSTSSVSARLLVLLITMSRALPSFTSARAPRARQAGQAGAPCSLCRLARGPAACPVRRSGVPVGTLSGDCFMHKHDGGSWVLGHQQIAAHTLHAMQCKV